MDITEKLEDIQTLINASLDWLSSDDPRGIDEVRGNLYELLDLVEDVMDEVENEGE